MDDLVKAVVGDLQETMSPAFFANHCKTLKAANDQQPIRSLFLSCLEKYMLDLAEIIINVGGELNVNFGDDCDINIKGTCNPLFWAAATGELSIIDFLLAKTNCDINYPSPSGKTAIMFAFERDKVKTVDKLAGKDARLMMTYGFSETNRYTSKVIKPSSSGRWPGSRCVRLHHFVNGKKEHGEYIEDLLMYRKNAKHRIANLTTERNHLSNRIKQLESGITAAASATTDDRH